MRSSDHLTFRTGLLAAKPAPGPLWKFRAIQIAAILLACLFADAIMTGGKVHSELVQDAGYLWRTVQDRLGR